jgi:hypothetical protein
MKYTRVSSEVGFKVTYELTAQFKGMAFHFQDLIKESHDCPSFYIEIQLWYPYYKR